MLLRNDSASPCCTCSIDAADLPRPCSCCGSRSCLFAVGVLSALCSLSLVPLLTSLSLSTDTSASREDDRDMVDRGEGGDRGASAGEIDIAGRTQWQRSSDERTGERGDG